MASPKPVNFRNVIRGGATMPWCNIYKRIMWVVMEEVEFVVSSVMK